MQKYTVQFPPTDHATESPDLRRNVANCHTDWSVVLQLFPYSHKKTALQAEEITKLPLLITDYQLPYDHRTLAQRALHG